MSLWVESHQDLRDHPKTVRFRRRLGVALPTAIGHLHMLWWWALSYADDGDLSQHEDDVIAEACGFDGDAKAFVEALVYAGFLDEDRQIHDWEDYAGRLVEKREANAQRMRQARAARRARLGGARAEHVQRTTDERAPDVQGLPDLTEPNLTEPNLTPTPLPPPATEREGESPPAPRQRGERQSRRNGMNGVAVLHDDTAGQHVDLTPVTSEDLAVWNQARAELGSGWLPSNAEKLAQLTPIGRGPDGGLHLRAPPWVNAASFRQQVARALLDAGDQAAAHMVIVEA